MRQKQIKKSTKVKKEKIDKRGENEKHYRAIHRDAGKKITSNFELFVLPISTIAPLTLLNRFELGAGSRRHATYEKSQSYHALFAQKQLDQPSACWCR